MASENVTTKFRVDVSDLKKNIKDANQQIKLFRAEFANASAGMEKGEETAESLTRKIEAQSKIVEAEKVKLQALKDELKKYEESLESGRSIIDDLTRKHEEAAKAFGEDSEEAKKYAEQLRKAQDAQERNASAAETLRVRIINQDTAVRNAEGQVSHFQGALDNLSQTETDTGDAFQQTTDGGINAFSVALGDLASKAITAVIGKLKELATEAMNAYKAFDEGRDNLIKATGATGDTADELTDVYRQVSKSVTGDLSAIGSAVGEVNTRFGYMGDDLVRASVKFQKFANITGTDTVRAVQLVSRAMSDAGIDADQYAHVLDQIAVAAQASGISVEKLTEYLTKYGAPMRALGFDTAESIALFSQWEKSGVNTEIAFSGMKAAIGKWSKEGKDARIEFRKTLAEIAAAPSIAEATTQAIAAFGQKAGPDLADAIQGGRFEYTDFLNIIQNSAGTVESTYAETQNTFDKLTLSLQTLKVTAAEAFAVLLDEIAPEIENLFPLIGDFVQQAVPALKDFLQWIKDNGSEISSLIAAIAAGFVAFQAVTMIQGAIAAFQSLAAAIELVGIKQAALNLLMAANPIGLIVAAIAALVAGFITLYNTSDEFREHVDLFWESMQETLAEFLDAWQIGWKMIQQGWENIQAGVENFRKSWQDFKDDWATGMDEIAGAWTGFWDGVKGTANGALSWLEDQISLVPKMINFIIEQINKIPGVNLDLLPESVSLPRLARGGIVSSSTIAQIGEAGREAIIPLDQNREGIREIAKELVRETAGVSGGFGSGSSAGGKSVNFVQNISSPKALSDYEVWRRTRNMLDLLKIEGV